MLNYFRLNFSSHAFYGGLFCHERSCGVRGRGNERKIRLLTFSSSSNRCALMKFYSYSTARSPESDRGGNCKLGYKSGVTVTLAIWGCSCHDLELSFIKLFCRGGGQQLHVSFCPHINSERRCLFPFFLDGDILSH